jgi:hypothetical protein
MKLEIGKTYKNRNGRLVKITKGMEPMIDENGKPYRDGWNGIYWGDSIDKKRPKIDNQRYEFNGKHWCYFSMFSSIRTDKSDNSFNIPEEDLVEVTF